MRNFQLMLCIFCAIRTLHAQDTTAQFLPPAYLSVEGWRDCLGDMPMTPGSSATMVCLPDTQPNECLYDSWTRLNEDPLLMACDGCTNPLSGEHESGTVDCFVAPCLGQSCPNDPEAECEDNYCGGCNAVWKTPNGDLASCDCEEMCTDDYKPVCSSNSITYPNECTFALSRCQAASLSMSSDEPVTWTIECDGICPCAMGVPDPVDVVGDVDVDGQQPDVSSVKTCPSEVPSGGGACTSNSLECEYNHVHECIGFQNEYKGPLQRTMCAGGYWQIALIDPPYAFHGCGEPKIGPPVDNEPVDNCNKGCTDIWDPVCGSDGTTYANSCEFEIEECRSSGLVEKDCDGECPCVPEIPECPETEPSGSCPTPQICYYGTKRCCDGEISELNCRCDAGGWLCREEFCPSTDECSKCELVDTADTFDCNHEVEDFGCVYWSHDDEIISFGVHTEDTEGKWLSFGFGTQMAGSDVYVANVNAAVEQYDPVNYAVPTKDNSQDLFDTQRSEKDGNTLVKFKRGLDTRDPHDHVIELGVPTPVVWARGTSGTFVYHGSNNRGVGEIDFQCGCVNPLTGETGQQIVNCFVGPCEVSTCDASPSATCTDNYCAGCHAIWTNADGSLAQCECNNVCPDIYSPVCGSNGRTYSNVCELEFFACDNNSLNLEKVCDGECPCIPEECKRECPEIFEPVCGSDDITYDNSCFLSISACAEPDSNIRAACDGDCPCPEGCNDVCAETNSPICGTDGKTYSNPCYLKLASCGDRSIATSCSGKCPCPINGDATKGSPQEDDDGTTDDQDSDDEDEFTLDDVPGPSPPSPVPAPDQIHMDIGGSHLISVCIMPKVVGPCDAIFERWWYDSNTNECGEFIYGGCVGNENNFATEEECVAMCVFEDIDDPVGPVAPPCDSDECCRDLESDDPWAEFDDKCPTSTDGQDGNIKNGCIGTTGCRYVPQCEQKSHTGRCRGAFRRYFYNHETETCELFTYGGCDENENNFETLEQCEVACEES